MSEDMFQCFNMEVYEKFYISFSSIQRKLLILQHIYVAAAGTYCGTGRDLWLASTGRGDYSDFQSFLM